MLHLAMISKNGTVWDVSLNEKVSPSNIFLFKLPKSCPCGYRGYSDDKGILNFIEGHLNRKFVQYHSSFNGNGHKTGMKHQLNGNICYTQSLQFGNALWLFGASFLGTSNENSGAPLVFNGNGKSYLF